MSEIGRVLNLTALGDDKFEGASPDGQGNRIYGGQVIAQSLAAAYRAIEGRVCVSLHAYFVRPGDPKTPILFEVERVRDGGSFSVRRVRAIQAGAQIFNLSATFQTPETGLEHQTPMPDAPAPETLMNEEELHANSPDRDTWTRRVWPIEVKPCDPTPRDAGKLSPELNVWFRARDPIGDDIALHQCVLAYASDMTLLDPSLRPHGIPWDTGSLQVASLDHAIWFHRPSDLTDWHLFVQDSPTSAGGRGFNRGTLYARDGRLVASATQDALIRYRPKV